MTWSLTLREEHRPRVFENRVLRRIFEPKRDEVKGGLRKLHNEELYNLYSSPSIIRTIRSRRMKWAGHVARLWEKKSIYRILEEKPEGKRPILLRIGNMVLNLRVLFIAGKFLSGYAIGFSRRAQLHEVS
jgi:hypothetical protein